MSIIFEHPLNERMRLFLRIERLLQRIFYHLNLGSVYDQQAAIALILELAELTNRGDIKTDLIKELDRQQQSLKNLLAVSDFPAGKIDSLIAILQQLLERIHDTDSKLTANIINDELLAMVKQRTAMAGGGCCFDTPLYHLWLHKSAKDKQKSLDLWLSPYKNIHKAVNLCLQTIRLGAHTSSHLAEQGFFNDTLEGGDNLQLLQIKILDHRHNIHPEISAGKHRLNLRFFELKTTAARPVQTQRDIEFELTKCMI